MTYIFEKMRLRVQEDSRAGGVSGKIYEHSLTNI